MSDTCGVYVQTDANGNITAVDPDAFLEDVTGRVKVDEGSGDRYHHAQRNYFDKPIMVSSGIYRYKLVGGIPIEKTTDEIAAEGAALPQPLPTQEETLSALIQKLAEKGIVP